MDHLYLDNHQIKTINFTYHLQLAVTCRTLFINPNLYSWGHVPHFPKQQFYTTQFHNSKFHSNTSTSGYSKSTISSLFTSLNQGKCRQQQQGGRSALFSSLILRFSENLFHLFQLAQPCTHSPFQISTEVQELPLFCNVYVSTLALIASAGLSRGYFILKRRGGTLSDFIVKVYILCIFTQQLDL